MTYPKLPPAPDPAQTLVDLLDGEFLDETATHVSAELVDAGTVRVTLDPDVGFTERYTLHITPEVPK